MNGLLCRIIGHRWAWQDILLVSVPHGFAVLPSWRTCTRCGHRQQDVNHETEFLLVPAFEPDDKLGAQVSRAMGWDR